MKSVVCECTQLVDTLFMCAPVRISDGDVEAVYIGPSGAFAVIDGEVDPVRVRYALRDIFGRSTIEVYHRRKGLFRPNGERSGPYPDEKSLDAAIYMHVTQGPVIWSEDDLTRFQSSIRIMDGRNRGVYKDNDGNWFISANGQFHLLSKLDSDHLLRLTLFGGIFGVHRFSMGKWFTGILYVLTGGLMGLGWLLDLFQLVTGTLRDKDKKLLAKPDPLGFSWYVGGLAVSVLLFCAYGLLSGVLSGSVNQILYSIPKSPETIQNSAVFSFLNVFTSK